MAVQNNQLLRTVLVITLIVLIGAGAAFAQGSQGSVSGIVKDASGAAIPGAAITLKNLSTNDVRTATTSNEGAFSFPLLNSGKYVLTAEKDGFSTTSISDVQVLPGQQASVGVAMKVGAKSETVEVVAGQELITTTTVELAGTVTQKQILNLPLLGRNPIELMRNQAGVPGILSANRENTGINGGRPGWTQITQDGINIQDNFIRNNGTDFVPSRPTSDTIGEFSVITGNVGSDSVGGASQVRLITPSGTNQFHGGAYEYNRNSALSATNFFSKRVNPVPKKPFLNQNQFGAKLGGPVLKDKLFFWGSYEGYRLSQQTLQSLIVPANADYLTGTYRWQPSGAATANSANVINLINANLAAQRAAGVTGVPANLSINSALQADLFSKYSTNGNSVACGDTKGAVILNTTCYQFNQGDPLTRNQESFRIDYNATSKHTLQLNYQRFTDKDARTDIDNVNPNPTSTLSTTNILWSGAWRWTITPRLLNEFRAGDFSSVVPFLRGSAPPAYLLAPAANNAATLTGLGLTNAQTNFVDQGRNVANRQFTDNASYTFGNHSLQFGTNYQKVMPHPYNYASVLPTVTFGFTSTSAFGKYVLYPTACSATVTTNCNAAGAAGTPTGATQAQVTAMNNYAAFLAGAISSVSQTYQVKDISSGFVAGEPNRRRFSYTIFHDYVKDVWRIRQNMTLTLGLKYEYWTPVSVEDSLALLPVIKGDLKSAMLDPNGTVAPASQLWKPDRNQFAPSVGLAWSLNDKTVIRGGYSLTFVNEDSVTAAQNAINGNFGLVGAVNQTSLSTIFTGAPTVPVPTFNPNRTFLDQLSLSAGGVQAAAFAIDPHLSTPSPHQISLGVQRELPWDSAVEARFVGTFSSNLWRGVDYNQQNAASNPAFLSDFMNARYNYFTCGTAAGTGCASAKPLTLFPTYDLGGLLTNSSVVTAIKTGQPGSLANFYTTAQFSDGSLAFPNARKTILPNPNIYGADAIINGGNLNYNSLQLEFRHRSTHGLSFQANYTFSKDLSDTYGDSQNRFEPLLDNEHPGLNYGRSPFDINHVVNMNFVYQLPIGRGQHFLGNVNPILDKFVGGWSMSSIIRWQTGSPFSFVSGYQTYQRRATDVQAYSNLSVNEIKHLLGIRNINGITYYIDPKVINSNGTAVGTDALDYTPQFAGQAFFNPQPTEFGSFKKLQFSGPSTTSWDATLRKSVSFWEAHPITTSFAADFFNATNSQFYYVGDQNINSSTFGRTSTRGLQNRVVQLSLRVDF